MIGYWCLILSGLAFYVSGVEMSDTTLLQKTVEHLVNYSALEALDQLNLHNIGYKIAGIAHNNHTNNDFPRHCNDYSKSRKPPKSSGMMIIKPDDGEPFVVYCEMEKFGGGWTRILYRSTHKFTFYRNWYEYKSGFGYLSTDGWLGLEKIYRLTKNAPAELLISLYDNANKWYFPQYKTFQIGSEATKYQLYIGNFTGDGGDSLSFSHNAKFSTYDRDHDSSSSNCASSNRGGWWYYNCAQGKLTGEPYASSTSYNYAKWPGAHSYAMRYAIMDIKPY